MGSTSVTANSSGAQTARQTYFPYGTVRTTEGTLPTDYTFTGQKLDASSSLMYYGARYYDAAIGRFAQPDSIMPNPYNPQSLNRYSYAVNNPVRYTDPTGRCIPEECGNAYGDVDDIYVDTQLNDSSGGDDTAAKTGGEQKPASPRAGTVVPWSSPVQGAAHSNLPGLECSWDYCYVTLGVGVELLLEGGALVCEGCGPVLGIPIILAKAAGLSANGQILWDKYGDTYWGLSGSAGRSWITPITFNSVRSHIVLPDNYTPAPKADVENFLVGLSGNATVGALGSWGVTKNLSGDWAIEQGQWTTPQVSLGAGWNSIYYRATESSSGFR